MSQSAPFTSALSGFEKPWRRARRLCKNSARRAMENGWRRGWTMEDVINERFQTVAD
jgi:hypothetical protein